MKRLKTLPKRYIWLAIPALIVLLLVLRFWFVAVLIAALAAIVLGVWAVARGSAPRIQSRRIGAGVLTAGALALVIGSVGVAAEVGASQPSNAVASLTTSRSGSSSDERTAAPRATPTPTPTPVQEVKQVEERSVVPFTSSTFDDANLASGTTAVTTAGVNGERVITHRVTYQDGVEVRREVAGDVIAVAPVNEVIARGTYVAPPPPPPAPANDGCHPSYEGACVPFADDVDCAGGSGNGPAYVQGPLRVVGPDVYDLERDSDGIACDV